MFVLRLPDQQDFPLGGTFDVLIIFGELGEHSSEGFEALMGVPHSADEDLTEEQVQQIAAEATQFLLEFPKVSDASKELLTQLGKL